MVSTNAIQVSLSQGNNTVQLPETGMMLKGVSVLGVPYLSIQLSPGKNAIIPLGNATGVGGVSFKDPMFRTHYQFPDISFIVYSPVTPTSPCIFYFGDPESDSIPLENLTGIVQNTSLTQGSTAGTMSTILNYSFPSGRIMITGVYHYASGSYSIINFPVSTGKQMYLFNTNRVGNDTIHPLAIEGSQSFSINLSSYVPASTTYTYYIVLYYQVMG
ncbi:MAG: hypothetical protein QW478_10185 [Candidatus Micrarchaeaceae archaeon]